MSSKLDGELWNRLETLERRRREALAQHEQALREFYSSADQDPDGRGRSNFQVYCETAENLEHTLIELQLLRWDVAR